ncbi:chloride channel protein [Levilactobacillus acidifarinae]|uniref:Chloride channel protein EriC n=1 Tax=Levilactobacillus acidifarinae DSM 19394 = JCM 15949 TaxID=1423715 RepID=A0A0R1LJI7_9LACO|nr:chloride channel protein [Levilactobacillus acidifarinae]KRK95941.1 hypothetical protein FD25_GL002402 [Levilactobacillus acidifarinae DSM 19394]GEO69246.1 chloride ion channel protein [Levilactobacillus acidifarinae]
MTKPQLIRLTCAGLLLSVLIAAVSGVFMILEGELITLFWTTIPAKLTIDWPYYLLLCGLGAWLLARLNRRWGPMPATAHQAMAELRQTQTVQYRDTFKNLAVALVILAGGAGVGPEAALLGAVVSLSVWEMDRLRYFYFNHETLKTVPVYRQLWWLIAPTGHLQRYRSTHSVPTEQLGAKKLNALFIANGLVAFFLLMRAIGHPSFITKMGASHWTWQQLWVVIPILLVSLLVGWLYHWGSRQLHALLQRLPQRFPRPFLGAAVIFLFAILGPRLLFSGQTFMALIPRVNGHQTAAVILAAAVLKLIFLQLCLATGWIGGDIFPIAFASILFGFGLAQLLPGFDALLIVAVVATSLATSLLGNIWVAGIFIALFFPANLLPVIALVLGLRWGGQRGWRMWCQRGQAG